MTATAAGPIADQAAEDLEALRKRLERDMLRALVALDTQRGTSELATKQAQTAAAVYRQVVQTLEAARREVADTTGRRAVEAVEAALGVAPSTLPTDVRQELDGIVSGATDEVASTFRDGAVEIRRAINAGTASGGRLDDLIADVADKIGTTMLRAQAAVDAAVMGAGRRAVVAEAQASGVDWVYVYVGPRDVKNRPFCRRWLGKGVTDPDRVPVEGGQPGPVGTYCGGYNCRHTWAPVTRRRAQERGVEIVDV